MADAVGNKAAKDYHIGTPTPDQGFFAKGLGHTDWGMKNRISRLFSPETGNTVMLAFDHGYIMGSTAGLERLDVSIAPLCEYADVLMGTRGAIRSCIPPTTGKAVCLRATHDSSVLFEDMSQGSGLALDMEDALRMNAAALAIQCFVGGAGERDSLEALCRAADAGYKYGVPILGVTAVGKEMARTTQYFLLATRILAELGASAVKTYYCEDFEKVASAIEYRRKHGRNFSIIAVAEGAVSSTDAVLSEEERRRIKESSKHSTISYRIAAELESMTGQETRVTVPGHYQRGGPPCPYDRVLATQFGTAAARLIMEKKYGTMVGIQEGRIVDVPLADAASRTKFLPTDHPLIQTARDVGIFFGD